MLGFGYMIPLGMSIASSTKVGNYIGANLPNLAKQSGIASLLVGSGISLTMMITIILIKDVWGGLFVDDEEVVALVASTMTLGALFEMSDALNCMVGGILRGVGLQKIGAIVNFIGYYLIGIPIGLYTAFQLEWELYGLF
jgi:MATE family multidrug resistance protein